jgi:hypothetical protein
LKENIWKREEKKKENMKEKEEDEK